MSGSTTSTTESLTASSSTSTSFHDAGCTGFCGCAAPDAQACIDFDDTTAPLGDWNATEDDGTVSVSTFSLSFPSALECTIDAVPDAAAAISQAFDATGSTQVTLSFDVYIAGCSVGDPQIFAQLVVNGYDIDLLLGPGAESFSAILGYGSGPSTDTGDELMIPSGEWVQVSLGYTASANDSYPETAVVAGSSASKALGAFGPMPIATVQVELGMTAGAGNACTLYFDDVTFAWGP